MTDAPGARSEAASSIVSAGGAPILPTRTGFGRVLAWGAWDWGSSAFNAVATTFVFTVYLTSK